MGVLRQSKQNDRHLILWFVWLAKWQLWIIFASVIGHKGNSCWQKTWRARGLPSTCVSSPLRKWILQTDSGFFTNTLPTVISNVTSGCHVFSKIWSDRCVIANTSLSMTWKMERKTIFPKNTCGSPKNQIWKKTLRIPRDKTNEFPFTFSPLVKQYLTSDVLFPFPCSDLDGQDQETILFLGDPQTCAKSRFRKKKTTKKKAIPLSDFRVTSENRWRRLLPSAVFLQHWNDVEREHCLSELSFMRFSSVTFRWVSWRNCN